jgi:outer membrane receptor for ferrienterochelin and colicin
MCIFKVYLHRVARVVILVYFFFISLMALNSEVEAREESFQILLQLPLKDLMQLEVTTPSGISQSVDDAPGTVVVITKQQIEERGYVNLLDLLQDLAGVDVNQKSTEEFYNQVAIRGNVGNNKFIIMQDGMRISSPTGEPIPISDNFPLYHAKQVEVAFGPVSAIYGADAFTGVINIITETAREIDGLRLSSVVGSDDYYHNNLNFGASITPLIDLRFGGHWQSSQDPDLSKTYTREFQNVDVLNTTGSVFRAAADREAFVAGSNSYSYYLNLDFNNKFNLGLTRSFLAHPTTTGAKPEKTIFDKDADWNTLIETYKTEVKSQYADVFSGKTKLSYSKYYTLPSTKFTNNFGNFNSFKFAKGQRWQLDHKVNYRINEKHHLTTGITLHSFNSIPKTTDLPSEYDPDKEAGDQGLFHIGTNNTLPITFFEQDYQNYGLFIQTLSKWNDQFSSFAGFRFDYDSRFNGTLNPRAGFIYKPEKSTYFKLMYSEAFLAPATNFAFGHFGAFKGTTDGSGRYESDFFKLPNPGLGPEKTRTIEANFNHKFNTDLVLKGDIYITRVEDKIGVVSGESNSEFIPGGIIASTNISDNLGQLNILGADLTIEQAFNWKNKKLNYWFSYSWVDGTLEKLGGETSKLPITAKNKIKAGFTFTYLDDYFITPKVIWVDKTNHFVVDRREKVSSYALLNMHLGVRNIFKNSKHWQAISAYLSITNLADVKYFNAGGGSNSFGSSPQDPRRFFVGIRKSFN